MSRKSPDRRAILLLLVLPVLSVAAAAAADLPVEIPCQKYVLDNGLTVLVHEDHKAPIVAFNVWYHVGSKNEKPGRTGFAHLYEHLMFNGSEHYNSDYFFPLEEAGATGLNGTTSEDRTNYFENVPVSALDLCLWMESDRMAYMKAAVDQDRLDEQREVVMNEKREGDNEPYACSEEMITRACFPPGHPYSWTVIGSMEDLEAASLEDVHAWYDRYYGPNNAVICLAGDIDAETALAKANEFFGHIPPIDPVARPQAWIAKRSGEQRETVQDRVPQARIYKVWNIPQWGTAESDYLDLVSDVLGGGKNSRLYQRLVYEDQIATDARAYIDDREIAGLFVIRVDAKPDADIAGVERAIDEELARFLEKGPEAREVERVRNQYLARFVRGSERIGGFGGKSDILCRGMTYAGDPQHYRTMLGRVRAVGRRDLHETARAWLDDGVYVLTITPYGEFVAAGEDVDRSGLPAVGEPPLAGFPDLQRATLSNGLEIVLAERHAVPVVQFQLEIDAGYAADGGPERWGLAQLVQDMLDEGTRSRTAMEISEECDLLGARLASFSGLDFSSIFLSALKENLQPSLELFADVVLNPSFPVEELERLRRQQLVAIQRDKVAPYGLAFRVTPQLLYGRGHAYAAPFSGRGSEVSISGFDRADLVDFHATWFKPDNARLLVAGDITMAELQPRLERLFRNWEPGEVPAKSIDDVAPRNAGRVFVLDRPGAPQSVVIAGSLAPHVGAIDEVAGEAMIRLLGGSFTSRLNMNLREDKHWTYGARVQLVDTKGQRPLLAMTSVQMDQTGATIVEIRREMTEILGDRPVTAEEHARTLSAKTLELPGRWETSGAVLNSLSDITRFGLADDYYRRYGARVRDLTRHEVQAAAAAVVSPDDLVWIVVGDREQVEPQLSGLGLGAIQAIDGDGNITD